jgi:hypothetical protein
VEHLAKLCRVRQFFETAPIMPAMNATHLPADSGEIEGRNRTVTQRFEAPTL